MAFTFADAKTFLRDYNREDTSTRADRVIAKIINDANRMLHACGDWDFDRRLYRTSLAAAASTGTVSVSTGATSVTGSSTAFATTDAGKSIRFDGEITSYIVASRSSATSITLYDAYLGATSLSGVTYELIQDRIALPATFRALVQAQVDDVMTPLQPTSFEDLTYCRKFYRETGNPRDYALEWGSSLTSTTDRAPYIWLYPGPNSAGVLELTYFAWPTEASSDSDVFGLPYAGEGVLRSFLVALMLAEQRDPTADAALMKAKMEAQESLAQFRARRELGQKEVWTPFEGGTRRRLDATSNYLASGEPRYV